MKNKKIIITNNQTLTNFTNEFIAKDFEIIDSNHISQLYHDLERAKFIYIEEKTLSKNPEIFSVINSLPKESPKVIIDNDVNIIQKILKRKSYKDIDRIPQNLERIFFDFLHNCMIKDNHSGYRYLLHTFFILYLDSSAAFNIKKCIYLPIEARFDTPEESVERCIRYAIKEGFRKSKDAHLNNIFSQFKKIPSNKQFIEAAFRQIKLNYPDIQQDCVSAK